jgi:tRNA threonylcarbamoyladenosine biosynthesis protein TsaE
MDTKIIDLADEAATQVLGARLAARAPRRWVVYLFGDLGAGKTTLVRGYLRALGYQGPVKSPTYTLLESYPLGALQVCHLDLYRVRDAEEVEYLGLREMLDGPVSVLVEWPQYGRGYLPGADLEVHLTAAGEGRRARLLARSADGEAVLRDL